MLQVTAMKCLAVPPYQGNYTIKVFTYLALLEETQVK